MVSESERGIVYIATGQQFVEEARISAQSAKNVMPDVPITLFTDCETNVAVFDDVRRLKNPRRDFGDQVQYLNQTPYDRTIFFDTDIYIDANISGLFDVLDEFDIAATQGLRNYSSSRVTFEAIEAIPECFPEYNSGVVAFKMNTAVNDFFERWKKAYAEVLKRGQVHNQAAFRLALYRSDVRIATLPSEYNCLFRHPGRVYGQVKAFHGRLIEIETPGAGKSAHVEQAIEKINSRTNLRIHYRAGNKIKLLEPSLFERVWGSLSTRGVIGTLRRIPEFVR